MEPSAHADGLRHGIILVMSIVVDTYLPTELKKAIHNLHLEGKKIIAISSPSEMYFFDKNNNPMEKDYSPEKASTDVDDVTILGLDDGRHIGFITTAGSHMLVMTYKEKEVPKADEPTEINMSMMFRFLVGKTIAGFNVKTTSNSSSFGFVDKGFDVNQEEFIEGLEIIFDDKSKLIFEADFDTCGLRFVSN